MSTCPSLIRIYIMRENHLSGIAKYQYHFVLEKIRKLYECDSLFMLVDHNGQHEFIFFFHENIAETLTEHISNIKGRSMLTSILHISEERHPQIKGTMPSGVYHSMVNLYIDDQPRKWALNISSL